MMWMHHSVEWLENSTNPKNGSIRWISGKNDRGFIYGHEEVVQQDDALLKTLPIKV